MNTHRSQEKSTVELSTLIAGFWRLASWKQSPQETLRFIERCVELGITTMDHAMVYRSEAPFGNALALKPELRDKIEIVTKFGIRPSGFGNLGARKVNHYDSSSAALVESVENSLQDLGTDHLDALLIHRPDYLMDCDEIANAFSTLKSEGKVKAFGVSNFTIHQFDALQHAVSFPLITNQVEFSPYEKENLDSGVFEQCARYAIRPMLWSCLGGGSILNPTDDKGQRILAALKEVAANIGAETIEQVVYAWILALPCNPHPLLGTSRIERVEQAAAALHLSMNREQWYQIWEASHGTPVP